MKDPVPTGCEPVDELLGGGFERGAVAQVYGPPAAGKTNIGLSAAVSVALDGDRALYIDTEGLSIDRFRDVISGQADEHVETVAGRIMISEAYDFGDQRDLVRDAEEVAEEVELIVLDSATGYYRIERGTETAEQAGDTLRDVANQVTHLLSLARKHDIAVVLTNQVFTDPETDRARPLGGHTLEHWTSVILRVDRFRGGNRRATLEKHRSIATGDTATFQITDTGIEDAEDR